MRSSAKSLTSTEVTPEASLRQETMFAGLLAALASVLAFAYCYPRGMLLLYGDAVAHLGIARRLTDSLDPGIRQLGSVWLPFPHLLMAPFATRMSWWQNGMAGALPSMCCYILSVMALYRLARLWLRPMAAVVAVLFYGLNPGLLYMQTTAMGEPVYLAEMIGGILFVAEAHRALQKKDFRLAAGRITAAVLVLMAAVFTRYDGWILAFLAWIAVCVVMVRAKAWASRAGGAFLLMTALLGASPFLWFLWNARQFGDWLYFMRGPYSAHAIDLRTSPPGSHHYPGWHSLWVSSLYYLKAAELGMVAMPLTDVLLMLAVAGTLCALWFWRREQLVPALVLLWMPVPFYAWSVAYGSVPIFLPVWPPHSYYNSRYGMEMLPAFALFLAFLVGACMRWLEPKRPRLAPLVAMAAICLAMIDAFAQMRSTPLVLKEAEVNARTRVPFELAYAKGLEQLPSFGQILAYTSEHVGAYQRAAIPLRRTINESDYYAWRAAMKEPALSAPFVIAEDGGPVQKAIQAHPGGLKSLMVICSTGQPCVHFYRSTRVGLNGRITKKQP